MVGHRDIIIDEILKKAKKDKKIFFLSADFGAPALDRYRELVPNQFLHLGISEQNMVGVAALCWFSLCTWIAVLCWYPGHVCAGPYKRERRRERKKEGGELG